MVNPAAQNDPESDVIDGVLVEKVEQNAGEVRHGSPFRTGITDAGADPFTRKVLPAFDPASDGAATYELGVSAATAQGAVLAAYTILPFAGVSAIFFPFGAMLIGLLGASLGVAGLGSLRKKWAIISLPLHLATVAAGYVQML
jgi:hypothetical protein